MRYDVIVLGGGPGGYVAAIKAAQSKLKVALVEKGTLGGVCLNWGCIPTKALLKTAKMYKQFLRSEDFGITIKDKSAIEIDFNGVKKRKDKIVAKLTGGVKMLLKKNGVDVFIGFGTVLDKTTVEVNGEKIKTNNLILATGASPFIPPIKGLKEAFEKGDAFTSKEMLDQDHLPKSLVIIGGGVIGVEFATLYSNLGVKVTVIEKMDRILTPIDDQIRTTFLKLFKNDNLTVFVDSEVKEVTATSVKYLKNDKIESIDYDKILVSIGTRPNLKGLENLNLKTIPSGILANERLETNIENVYAIGDLNGKMMLAHVASAEGIIAVENILGKKSTIHYDRIPAGIYTFPEIAYVGITEQEAIDKKLDYKTSVFPFAANGKALADGESDGFIKLIADKKYGEILGMHILGSEATNMISEGAITMEMEGTVFELAKSVHPHPTISEIIGEVAEGIIDKPINI